MNVGEVSWNGTSEIHYSVFFFKSQKKTYNVQK